MHITNICNLLTRGWSIKPYTYFKPNIQFFVFVFLISETKYTCESRRYRDISDRSTRTQNMQEGSYRIFFIFVWHRIDATRLEIFGISNCNNEKEKKKLHKIKALVFVKDLIDSFDPTPQFFKSIFKNTFAICLFLLHELKTLALGAMMNQYFFI